MRVITFSRNFPAHHPRKGQPTYFVEKILMSMIDIGHISMSRAIEKSRDLNIPISWDDIRKGTFKPKHHTIRNGHRWKEGDMFSPRFWGDDINPKSGRKGPYQSKQIEFVHPVPIVKTWPFEVDENGVCSLDGKYLFETDDNKTLEQNATDRETIVAANDGLTWEDWNNWLVMPVFKKEKPFEGQIICWNPEIEY